VLRAPREHVRDRSAPDSSRRLTGCAVCVRYSWITSRSPARDVEASRRFYEAALFPWGIRVVESSQGSIGFGPQGSQDFWIGPGEAAAVVHLAFAAPDRATVDAFHETALAAGGSDNRAPGLRPQYHATYYAAYVLDLDGNNVEAVFHGRP
jgi:catechol 2,3-dioxygenase-like lactoylglutathione lyase family enzyme